MSGMPWEDFQPQQSNSSGTLPWEDFKGSAPVESPKFYELEKQQGTPKSPSELLGQFGKQLKEAVTSPVPGSLLSLPVKALQETAGQAGNEVAKRLIDKGVGTTPARLAGLATSVLADFTSYVGAGEAAKVANKTAETASKVVGEQASRVASGFSNVSVKAIKELFDKPFEVLKAISSKKAGAELQAAKEAAGVTREEEFLISKAGDRATGGARTVGESLRSKFDLANLPEVKNPPFTQAKEGSVRAVFIGNQDMGQGKQVGLYNILGNHPSAGSTVTLDALQKQNIPVVGKVTKDSPVEGQMTVGELMALKRAAGKLSSEAKGSEKALWAPIARDVTAMLETKSKDLVKALKQYSTSKNKESFKSLVPLTKQGRADYLKTLSAPFVAGISSPFAVGAYTLAAKAASKAISPVSKAVGAVGGFPMSQLLNSISQQQIQSVRDKLNAKQKTK